MTTLRRRCQCKARSDYPVELARAGLIKRVLTSASELELSRNERREEDGLDAGAAARDKRLPRLATRVSRAPTPPPTSACTRALALTYITCDRPAMSGTSSNTLLLRRQLTELTKKPVEGFSAGKALAALRRRRR
jgi:hypothetical protein